MKIHLLSFSSLHECSVFFYIRTHGMWLRSPQRIPHIIHNFPLNSRPEDVIDICIKTASLVRSISSGLLSLSLSSSFSISVSLQQQTKNPQKSTNLLPNSILHSSYLLSLPRRVRGHFSTAIALPIEFNIQWIPFATYMLRRWCNFNVNCPNF